MFPALWISKSGLDAQQTNISVTSNNLANASTVGYKKSRAIFEDLLYQNVNQPGGRSSAGTTNYTRNGQFTLNEEGTIVTIGSGYPVLPEIQVPENAKSITVGSDGQVSISTSDDAEAQVVGQITVTNFINEAGLEPVGENLFAESQASGAPIQGIAGTDGAGAIKQGCLEVSNVNVTEELVNLISAQRVYEMNSKVLSTVDEMMGALTQRL